MSYQPIMTRHVALQSLTSERDIPLLFSPLVGVKGGGPWVTVELCDEWHCLYLVYLEDVDASLAPHYRVEQVSFDELDNDGPIGEVAYVDHVPNPSAVDRWAERAGFTVVLLADELIGGRWQLEVGESVLKKQAWLKMAAGERETE